MAIPGFEQFMLPLLELAADGKEHSLGEAIERIAEQFKLGAEERDELLPSGTMTRLKNRIAWAVTYLSKSVLIERTGRGRFRITDRGRGVLRGPPETIDIKFLSQYPELQAFRSKRSDTSAAPVPADPEATPLERLDVAYSELKDALADELLSRVRSVSPKFFEQLVVDVLVAMGYGGSRIDAAEVVGKSGDGGIDGTIKEDLLGLDVIYVQAKRWENPVGRKEIQSFAGSLDGERATKGVFITTSSFSKEAREYVRKIAKRIVLIDGDELAAFMIDHGVGVSTDRTLLVRRIDGDYFENE